MFLPDINTSDKSNNKYDISVAIAAPKAPNLGIRIIFIITFESALKEVSIANNLSIPCGKKYCVLKVVDHAIKSIGQEIIAICRYTCKETGRLVYANFNLDEFIREIENNIPENIKNIDD